MWRRRVAVMAVVGLLVAGCSDAESPPESPPADSVGATADGGPADVMSTTTAGDADPTQTAEPPADQDSTSEPEPEPEQTTEAEPTTEPEPSPEPEPTTQPEPTSEPEPTTEPEPTSDEPTSEPPPDGAGPQVFDVQGSVVFTTPARAAYCQMFEDGGPTVVCEVQASTVPASDPLRDICPEGFGFYRTWQPGVPWPFSCNYHEGITTAEFELESDDGWVDPAHTDTLPTGQVIGVLGYDQTLRMSGLECSVRPDGLTCSTPDGGHGFTVNTASWVEW